MTDFGLIRNIDPSDENSWKDKVFLTFDIDWASDDVLKFCIDLVEKEDVCATWFATHQTDLLDRLRENPKFELGIHPNFNFLLNGNPSPYPSAAEIVTAIQGIVPDAVSVRSHSMTQSTGILKIFHDRGLTHDCNHFIPYQSGMPLKPWHIWTGLIKIPYFWEDDLECLCDNPVEVSDIALRPGLRVFDFHPIHVFLNTEKLDRYEFTRSVHANFPELSNYVNAGPFGARSSLQTLLGKK